MRIFKVTTKTALVRSRIPGVRFAVNPYMGCGHGCRYCYAVFMKKYTRYNRHTRWGDFVEAKVNIPGVLRNELARRRSRATSYFSSTCDPYQPAEQTHRLTRRCIEILQENGWSVDILTRSPLVLRDLDLLQNIPGATVGFSIGTDNEQVRRILEPRAPPLSDRIAALRRLREHGIQTWVFVAPILPMNPERFAEMIGPYAQSIEFDQLNYPGQVVALFRRHGWDYALEPGYSRHIRCRLGKLLSPLFQP